MNGGVPKYRTGLERSATRRPTSCITRNECTHTKYTRILTYIYRVNGLFFICCNFSATPRHVPRALSPHHRSVTNGPCSVKRSRFQFYRTTFDIESNTCAHFEFTTDGMSNKLFPPKSSLPRDLPLFVKTVVFQYRTILHTSTVFGKIFFTISVLVLYKKKSQ